MKCQRAIAILLLAALVVLALPSVARAQHSIPRPFWTDPTYMKVVAVLTIVTAAIGITEGVLFLRKRSRDRTGNLDIKPIALRFRNGAAGGAASQSITLRNRGGTSLVVTELTLTSPCFELVDPPPLPLTIAAKREAPIRVAFSSRDAACRGSLNVGWNAAKKNQRTETVKLVGAIRAAAALEPAPPATRISLVAQLSR